MKNKITKKAAVIISISLLGFVLAFPAHSENKKVSPLPLSIKLNQEKVKLGRMLFRDPRLSNDNALSCASCHKLSKGGTDNQTLPTGIHGREGRMHTITVYNSVFNKHLFWDGRLNKLEDQVTQPIHTSFEFNSDWNEVISKLRRDPKYVKLFHTIYHDKIKPKYVKNAIATYERSLITPNARFDQYLRGDKNALTANEIKGYQLFQSLGCIQCHDGVNMGGNKFRRLGVHRDYFADKGEINEVDLGRYSITDKEVDRHVFRVPSLRNVALTNPYFHDGSIKTLKQVIRIMAKYQLGKELTQQQVDLIAQFLTTLTGKHPELKQK